LGGGGHEGGGNVRKRRATQRRFNRERNTKSLGRAILPPRARLKGSEKRQIVGIERGVSVKKHAVKHLPRT